MAIRTFGGSASSDASDPLNYSGTGAILATDSLVFPDIISGERAATFDAATVCAAATFGGNNKGGALAVDTTNLTVTGHTTVQTACTAGITGTGAFATGTVEALGVATGGVWEGAVASKGIINGGHYDGAVTLSGSWDVNGGHVDGPVRVNSTGQMDASVAALELAGATITVADGVILTLTKGAGTLTTPTAAVKIGRGASLVVKADVAGDVTVTPSANPPTPFVI
jgi:hypothetical protein